MSKHHNRRQDRNSSPQEQQERPHYQSPERAYNPVMPDPLRELVLRSQNVGRPQTRSAFAISLPSVHEWIADGQDHTNFYTGTSSLSQLLGERNTLPFTHPYAGQFKTLSGFGFFLRSENDDDFFRDLVPGRFRQHAQGTPQRLVHNATALYLHAVWCKLVQYPLLAEEFAKSTLPLDYYYERYERDSNTATRVRPLGYDWQIHGMNVIREHLRAGTVPTFFQFMRKDVQERLDTEAIEAALPEERQELRYALELGLLHEQLMLRFGHMQHEVAPKPKVDRPAKQKKPRPATERPAEDFSPRYSSNKLRQAGSLEAEQASSVEPPEGKRGEEEESDTQSAELPHVDGQDAGAEEAQVELQSSTDVAQVQSATDSVWVDKAADGSLVVVDAPADSTPSSSEPQA